MPKPLTGLSEQNSIKKKKKKSSRLGKKRDSETLSHLFYVSLEGSRTSVLPNSMIRIMEKGEVFKKTYIPTSLYLRFPKGATKMWFSP